VAINFPYLRNSLARISGYALRILLFTCTQRSPVSGRYAAETEAETSKTKRIPRTTETRTLRITRGVNWRDRMSNEQIRHDCSIRDIIRWIRESWRYWKGHAKRMAKWNTKTAEHGLLEDHQRDGRKIGHLAQMRHRETIKKQGLFYTK